jgi:hypothetical protein
VTFQRLILDLQDAWRQALADGPRGWGCRGWIEVRIEGGAARVVLTVSAERGHRLYAGLDVLPDAEVFEIWGAADVVSELLRVSARHFRSATEEVLGEFGWRCGEGEILYLRCGGFVRL